MRVLISGASGFIGTELVRQLETGGHIVSRLVRSTPRAPGEFLWSPSEHTIDPRAMENIDAVINLSGASTGRLPWTSAYRREILYSRVNATTTIAEAMGRSATPPGILLNGSAVGFYGDRPGVRLDESAAKGSGFLSDVVEAWEQAAHLAPSITRVVTFRTGVVVGSGGAFTPLTLLTRLGLGARLGSGQQNWPWVALADEAAAIRHLLSSRLEGVVNIAGPVPATAAETTHALAGVLGRWDPWVIPEFAIRALGEAGRALLLSSQDVVPKALLDDGFVFQYETIEKAVGTLGLST